jgi:hypothetical protein
MKFRQYLSGKEIIHLLLISLVPVFLIWLPFALKLKQFWFLPIEDPGMFNIIRNWDGPNYIVVAKTFYDLIEVGKYFILDYSAIYHTAHLPLYPVFIFLFSPIFGWLYSGVVVNLIFGVLLNILFYVTARKYTKHPMLLTFVFTVFPARFLILRGIIAPETMVVFFTLLSFYFWNKNQVLYAALAASLAFLTKVQAIFLFPAFAFAAWEKWRHDKKDTLKYLWLLLIPLTVLGLCLFYYYRVGDFFAFLNAQKGNKLSLGLPFMQFNFSNPWVNTGYVEDIVFYIIGMFVLIFALKDTKERAWLYFTIFYSIFLLCIPQRDINRLTFPLLPIFLLQFEQFFTSKVFKWALICALPAIYLYTLNFVMTNQAPLADWTNFIAR